MTLIVDKVRKLLKLSQSPNANEAASAAAKAQALIDEHHLSEAMLALDTDAPAPDEPIENFGRKDAPLDTGEQNDRWRWYLASTVMQANGCRGYVSRGSIQIVGRPSDVDTVRYLFAYLKAEVERLANRDGAGCGRTWRNNYRLGVIQTIEHKLAESHQQFMADARASAPAGDTLALVRVNTALARVEARGATVDAWLKANMRLRAGSSSRTNYNHSAREQGRAAGEAIAINRAKGGLSSGQRRLA